MFLDKMPALHLLLSVTWMTIPVLEDDIRKLYLWGYEMRKIKTQYGIYQALFRVLVLINCKIIQFKM